MASPADQADRRPGFGPGSRGVWCSDAGPGAARRLGLAGFDWVALDMQHGTYGRAELLAVARSWHGAPADLVVRVPSSEFTGIGLALDAGAAAVVVPQVDSPAEARAAVEAASYPPRGRRSAGPLAPTWGEAPTDGPLCAVMVESAAALDRVEEIAAVEGVGLLFVGPNDLSLTLGSTVDALLDDTSPDSALDRILAAGRAAGVPVGAYGGDPATAARFAARGIDCLAVATDVWITTAGAARALA
ncbi:4-hydroxy-2-oxoheptanedioate aldolase [Klenkia soli]|uniref:4-hydroxy-2-oxoheptanedioate aldolase n=1 Tax=Klenkia soli TaxID=1052260 RepID=A0A1H0FTC2_9ACTN|nr:aldolase/citrate lyase family protein [Klenkia soli]SDN97739.1 4-hydroxy-2-oxoheptanedioate aldolase [Klenkia soli]